VFSPRLPALTSIQFSLNLTRALTSTSLRSSLRPVLNITFTSTQYLYSPGLPALTSDTHFHLCALLTSIVIRNQFHIRLTPVSTANTSLSSSSKPHIHPTRILISLTLDTEPTSTMSRHRFHFYAALICITTRRLLPAPSLFDNRHLLL
jgi:hypothetical protein